MNINFINNVATVYSSTAAYSAGTKKSAESNDSVDKSKFSEAAATYEKSEDIGNVSAKETDRSAMIAKLKADAEEQKAKLFDVVRQSIAKQGQTIGLADDMWRFLADGNFEVDEETKKKAQADIAEDGYWGVDKTSDRILDFAKALSGGDSSKAEQLLDAFKKGFEEATKTWGKELPDISQRTYDAVLEKFETWKNEDK